MRERSVEHAFNAEIKKNGGISIKLVPLHLAGLPDRLALLPGGRLFFAEIKAPGKRPRAIQTRIMSKIKNLGFEVYVLDSLEAIKKVIENA